MRLRSGLTSQQMGCLFAVQVPEGVSRRSPESGMVFYIELPLVARQDEKEEHCDMPTFPDYSVREPIRKKWLFGATVSPASKAREPIRNKEQDIPGCHFEFSHFWSQLADSWSCAAYDTVRWSGALGWWRVCTRTNMCVQVSRCWNSFFKCQDAFQLLFWLSNLLLCKFIIAAFIREGNE